MDERVSPSTHRPRQDTRALDVWAIALTFLSVAVQGHRFGVGNHEILLASARHLNDPAVLANDWAVSSQIHHPLLTIALAVLMRVFGESGAFLLAHLATRLLLLMGVHRLCGALLGERPVARLLAMVLCALEPRIWIGGHFLQGGQFEGAFLGMALAVWVLAKGAAWIESQVPAWQVGIWGGLAVLGHLFIGMPVLAVVVLAFLARRRTLRAAADSLVVAAIAALVGSPSWVAAAIGFLKPSATPLPPDLLIAILEARHPHHHMPWTWSPWHWAMAVGVIGAGAWAMRRTRALDSVPMALLGWYLVTGALFCHATWNLCWPVVVYFQAFRLLGLLVLVCACAWAGVVAEFASSRCVKTGILAALLILSFRVPALFLCAVVATAILLRRRQSLQTDSLRQHPSFVPAILAAAFGAVVILMLQFVPPVRSLANRLHREHWLVDVETTDPGRAELTRRIAAVTSPDDVLVVPLSTGGWRLIEQRPIVADLKFVPFENAPLWEWARRILVLRGDLPADFRGTPEDARPAILAWRSDPHSRGTAPFGNSHRPETDQAIARNFGAAWIVYPPPATDPSARWSLIPTAS